MSLGPVCDCEKHRGLHRHLQISEASIREAEEVREAMNSAGPNATELAQADALAGSARALQKIAEDPLTPEGFVMGLVLAAQVVHRTAYTLRKGQG